MRLIDADALLETLKNEWAFLSHDDYVQEVINAPTVQREGWLPIKSAPKGEAVLVAGGDCDYPCSAQWSGLHDEPWVVDGQMNTYAEIGWPTHWMQLPDAPTE